MGIEQAKGHNINRREERDARESMSQTMNAVEEVIGVEKYKEPLGKARENLLTEDEKEYLRSSKEEIEEALKEGEEKINQLH